MGTNFSITLQPKVVDRRVFVPCDEVMSEDEKLNYYDSIGAFCYTDDFQ